MGDKVLNFVDFDGDIQKSIDSSGKLPLDTMGVLRVSAPKKETILPDQDISASFGEETGEMPKNMADLATAYGKEKRSIKSAEAVIKQRKGDLAVQEATLYALLENAGISSFSSSGYTYFMRVDMYASVDASKTDVVFKWLKDEDLEYLIKRTVNSRSLSSAIKTVIEETGETPGEEEGINIKTVNRVGVRKK